MSPTGSVTVTVFPVVVFTANPLNIEYTSKSNFHNYPKNRLITTALHDFLGNGIFNINGEQWKVQRKTASYEFNAKSLRSFVLDKVGYEMDNRLVPFLRDAIRRDVVVDLQDVLDRFAFDNICNLVFLEDPDCLYGRSERGEKFFRAFDEAAHLSVHRAMVPFTVIWKLKRLFNMESERRLRDSMATVHEFVEGFIRSRRKDVGQGQGKDKSDFLSRFIEEGIHSDEFIRDILISFMLAGRDTTPSALTWFFWVVSSRPDVVEKIRDELRTIRASRNVETFTLDELREMNYLHAAISESLRLYPPVTLLPRECDKDDVMPDGTKVKKGWTVMYSNYAMGRTEKIWGEDCREFRPERWLEGGVFKPRNVFEYAVFHAGPRLCLGKDMAYIQMKAVVAGILDVFDVEVVEERGEMEVAMTLRMKGGLPVRVRERTR